MHSPLPSNGSPANVSGQGGPAGVTQQQMMQNQGVFRGNQQTPPGVRKHFLSLVT